MKKILAGVMLGICLPIIAAWLFISLGGMPVATKGPPLPFEKAIARKALHAAMAGATAQPSPLPPAEINLVAGARIYEAQCAVCHGTLGKATSAIAAGMYPPPPQLLPPKKGVTDDPVGEIYWKVRHGIRLTGMPGFGDSLTDTELWQVSLLLLHADQLPSSAESILRRQ